MVSTCFNSYLGFGKHTCFIAWKHFRNDLILEVRFTKSIITYPAVVKLTKQYISYVFRLGICSFSLGALLVSKREWAKLLPSEWGRWLLVNLAWTLDLNHLSLLINSPRRTKLLISHAATVFPPRDSGNGSQLAERQPDIHYWANEITQLCIPLRKSNLWLISESMYRRMQQI